MFIARPVAAVSMAEESIETILKLSQRKLVVANHEVVLSGQDLNEIFVLMIEESRGSAGGRAAGSGHRRISRVIGFRCNGGLCSKIFDSENPQAIESFEIPYSAVAMDIRLSDNSPLVVQGIIDPELVKSYLSIASGE